MVHFNWGRVVCRLSCCLVFVSFQPIAQEAEEDGLEVIKVTAQRRVENIQEVPISIASFSEDLLDRIGAQNIDDLGLYTPGLETNNTMITQPKFTIRGITTNDFGAGAEPAVAVYLDGVYVGRSGSALTNFIDIERVEVLKGPQGTLFGRNSAAGAIHIISKKPIAEQEGKARVTVGNYGKRKLEGVWNTPISNDVLIRLNASINDMDGYIDARYFSPEGNVENIQLGQEDDDVIRFNLLWDISADSKMILRTEYSRVSQDARPIYGLNKSYYREGNDGGSDPFGVYETDMLSEESRRLFGASIEFQVLFDDVEFLSLTALRRFETQNFEEEDGAAFSRAFFATTNREHQDQASQEFRWTGISYERLKWTIGATYFQEQIRQNHEVQMTTNALDTFALIQAGINPIDIPSIPIGSGLTGFFTTAMHTEFEQLAGMSSLSLEEFAAQTASMNLNRDWFEVTKDRGDFYSFALYGDATYSVTDAFDMTFGLRYTLDRKSFEINSNFQNHLLLPLPMLPAIPVGLVFAQEYDTFQKKSWHKWTPRLVLDYQFDTDLMGYISYAQGFKAGGFNSLGLAQPFDEEEVTNVELGVKSMWFENHIKANASIFSYRYDDLQILKLTQNPGALPTYNVRNVDAKGEGFELDLQWMVNDWLTLIANYGYLDTEYTRYMLFPGETAKDDLTGRALSGVPKHQGYIAGEYLIELEMGDLLLHLDATYVSKRNNTTTDISKLSYIPAEIPGLSADNAVEGYWLANTQVTFESHELWQVSLYMRNLMNEKYLVESLSQGREVGSTGIARGRPRTLGLIFQYAF
ncbi:TonB-dependent receptor [Algicola sagamiensis]|uniref:TonB-dependent receptor n=1 Tax=Algicola sagamiensis TaxID=163869 RepID=UPI0003670778|nr:TonB-dependent receptor [Algicola sagamiensis]